MSFNRVKPLGWNTGDVLTEDEINDLDIDHANAVDGAGGGTNTLTAPLVFEGDNFEIDEDLAVNGSMTFGSASSDLALFNASANFLNGVTLGSSSGDSIDINGAATFNADVVVSSGQDLTANGNVTLGNSTGDAISILGTMIARGPSQLRWKLGVGPNADTTFLVADGNQIIVTPTLGANRLYTPSTTGALDGDFMFFAHRASGGAEITIACNPGITIVQNEGALVVFDDGVWRGIFKASAV